MSLKYNTKQRNKTIQGLRSFKDTLPTKVKRILKNKGHIYSETLDNWRYIVGDELFKVCYPRSFKNSNKLTGSCLKIMVKRGSEVEIEYSKKNIIKKMNSYFGYNVVNNIKLNTFDIQYEKSTKKKDTNVTNSKHIKKIKNIKNDKVKNSLISLNKLFKAR
tara:strand:- start:1121 stop:1603 length:483 start_codon:yes stop_codon:yes gene_type:complete